MSDELDELFQKEVGDPRRAAFEAALAEKCIIVKPGALHHHVEAVDVLLSKITDSGPIVFQRFGALGETYKIPLKNTTSKMKDNVKRSEGAVMFTPLSFPRAREIATRHIVWKKWDARSGDYKPINADREVIESYLAKNQWKAPVLNGIQRCPTITEDGSVLASEGYHEETGIYFDFSEWPKLKKKLTLSDAVDAREYLEDWISEFPIPDAASRACFISALCTGIVRPQLTTAPFYNLDSSTAGAGKTKLAMNLGIALNGHPPAVMTLPRDEAETKKLIFSALWSGDPVIVIDNVNYFGGNTWCAIATSDNYKDRVLGQSKILPVSTRALFLVTGINPVIFADISRRMLDIRLEPTVERPEERIFKRNIEKYTLQNRHKIINSALTILSAYAQAGRPKLNLKPFGSFEEWSARVRDPLVWCGGVDPCDTRARIEAVDPDREAHGALLEAWREAYGGKEVLVIQMKHDADTQNDDLRTVLIQIAGDGKTINQRRLGKKISGWEGRICDGMKIVRGSTFRRSQKWKLDGVSIESIESLSEPTQGKCQTNTGIEQGKTHTDSQTHTITQILQEACDGLSITPAALESQFSDESLSDIADGTITPAELRDWAESCCRESDKC